MSIPDWLIPVALVLLLFLYVVRDHNQAITIKQLMAIKRLQEQNSATKDELTEKLKGMFEVSEKEKMKLMARIEALEFKNRVLERQVKTKKEKAAVQKKKHVPATRGRPRSEAAKQIRREEA